jgi:hypothetical protein
MNAKQLRKDTRARHRAGWFARSFMPQNVLERVVLAAWDDQLEHEKDAHPHTSDQTIKAVFQRATRDAHHIGLSATDGHIWTVVRSLQPKGE